jgi:hypothetical protein
MLYRITNERPGFSLDTADGPAAVDAIGDALVHVLTHDGQWRCYEVNHVLLVKRCPAVLYSTRVMRDRHGFQHNIDAGHIDLPSRGGHRRSQLRITDDGSSFAIPVAFVRPDQPAPTRVAMLAAADACASAMAALNAATASTTGTSQATLFHKLGFPYEQQWRHVPSAVSGHGLPPNTVASTTIPVRDAVMRGRSRALPFVSSGAPSDSRPPPGAVFYTDFAGPLVKSHPHAFTCYCGAVDAGSGYGRLFPAHGMTAVVASATLSLFTADVAAKMGLTTTFKPSVVRSDQGSAFVSHHFREFLGDRQIQLSLAATYTPQQNAYIERFWGIVFGTARVLLCV